MLSSTWINSQPSERTVTTRTTHPHMQMLAHRRAVRMLEMETSHKHADAQIQTYTAQAAAQTPARSQLYNFTSSTAHAPVMTHMQQKHTMPNKSQTVHTHTHVVSGITCILKSAPTHMQQKYANNSSPIARSHGLTLITCAWARNTPPNTLQPYCGTVTFQCSLNTRQNNAQTADMHTECHDGSVTALNTLVNTRAHKNTLMNGWTGQTQNCIGMPCHRTPTQTACPSVAHAQTSGDEATQADQTRCMPFLQTY